MGTFGRSVVATILNPLTGASILLSRRRLRTLQLLVLRWKAGRRHRKTAGACELRIANKFGEPEISSSQGYFPVENRLKDWDSGLQVVSVVTHAHACRQRALRKKLAQDGDRVRVRVCALA